MCVCIIEPSIFYVSKSAPEGVQILFLSLHRTIAGIDTDPAAGIDGREIEIENVEEVDLVPGGQPVYSVVHTGFV